MSQRAIVAVACVVVVTLLHRSLQADPAVVTDPVCVGWDQGPVVYRLSPADEKWETHTGPAARLSRTIIPAIGPHAAVVLAPDDGYGGWLFDLHTEKWSPVPRSPVDQPRVNPNLAAVAFVGRELVAWGHIGADPEGAVLDTATMKWRPMPQAPVGPRYRCLKGVVGTKLIVWGGYGPQVPRGERGPSGPLNDGAVYDVATDKWVKMAASPEPFAYGAAGVVWNGRFVVLGGRTDRTFSATPLLFDPRADKWEALEPMPIKVGINAACAAVGDRLVVWSGSTVGSDGPTAGGAAYDFWTRQWQPLPEAPVAPRLLAFANGAGARVTFWGGWSSARGRNTFHPDGATYDFEMQTWKPIPDLPGNVPMAMHPGW